MCKHANVIIHMDENSYDHMLLVGDCQGLSRLKLGITSIPEKLVQFIQSAPK